MKPADILEKKTISILFANLFSVLSSLLIAFVTLFFFDLQVGLDISNLFQNKWEFILFPFIFLLSIFIHEVIHAATFALFVKHGWKSIRIGMLWDKMTPYAHCSESLKRNQYALAVILPFIVLGLIPIFWSFIQSNLFYLVYGILMSTAARGDILILILLFQVSKNAYVQDHDKEIGFWVILQ